jgi:lipopolysaccharide transport system permease protein
MFGVVLQFWFWATPVVYPINILPPFFQQLIRIQPHDKYLMGAYQQILVNARSGLTGVLVVAGHLACSCCCACWGFTPVFQKHAGEMVDEL